MGDSKLDWASLLGGLPDSDELMSLLMNDVKVEKPEDEQPQEGSKFLVQPTTVIPQQQDIHNVATDVETGSSSCRLNDQNKIIRNGGCLINPLGFPYRSRMQVLAADAPSGSGELLEHTRFLEEKVEQLRNENAHLKKLLSLEAASTERLPEIFFHCMYRKEKRSMGKGKTVFRTERTANLYRSCIWRLMSRWRHIPIVRKQERPVKEKAEKGEEMIPVAAVHFHCTSLHALPYPTSLENATVRENQHQKDMLGLQVSLKHLFNLMQLGRKMFIVFPTTATILLKRANVRDIVAGLVISNMYLFASPI
ncbi:hypothetical protein GOBAR_AA23199 [Gossypium barbadense]|uniref:BZIP domain-containing protein n=1 Tax=Gossypium barbadense TaxID=3634 RepID=A0A2P5X298_GOSBA|nr:hypothetical protein GOBAR_AA23199 [Gossypium barbadense]